MVTAEEPASEVPKEAYEYEGEKTVMSLEHSPLCFRHFQPM